MNCANCLVQQYTTITMNARSCLQGFKNGCTIDQEDDYTDGMMNISKRWRHHEACKRVGKSCKIEHKKTKKHVNLCDFGTLYVKKDLISGIYEKRKKRKKKENKRVGDTRMEKSKSTQSKLNLHI